MLPFKREASSENYGPQVYLLSYYFQIYKMGIRCEERPDGITVHPGEVRPAVVNTYEDHRMAMAFSLVGCRVKGIVIDNPGCCRKTFENYFELLTSLG